MGGREFVSHPSSCDRFHSARILGTEAIANPKSKAHHQEHLRKSSHPVWCYVSKVEVDSEQSSQHPTRSEGLFDVLQERKEPALRMAKDLWQEAGWTQGTVDSCRRPKLRRSHFVPMLIYASFCSKKVYYKYLSRETHCRSKFDGLVSLGTGMDQSCGAQWCLEAVYPIGLSSWMAMGTADLAAKRRCRYAAFPAESWWSERVVNDRTKVILSISESVNSRRASDCFSRAFSLDRRNGERTHHLFYLHHHAGDAWLM